MKKTKSTNYFNYSLISFGILLLFFACQPKDEILIPEVITQNEILQKFKENFNLEDYKKALPYKFNVDWNNTNKLYSEDLNLDYYEFPVVYTSLLNPDYLNGRKKLDDYNISYKIIASIDENSSINFYVLKSMEKIGVKELNTNIGFQNNINFTGLLHLLNKENDIVFAKKLKKGKDEIIPYYGYEFQELNPNKSKTITTTCNTVTYAHYEDRYAIWDGAAGQVIVPLGERFLYYSSKTTCTTSYLPESDGESSSGGGGAGSGTYKNGCNVNGKYAAKNSDDACIKEVEDVLVECELGLALDENGNCVEEIVIEAPDEPIEDMADFLKCLDKTKRATVTIYSKQPDPSNPNTDWTQENSVGHAFITISQGQYTLSYGFYPKEGKSIGYLNATAGTMGRNQNYKSHVSVSKTISSTALKNLITLSLDFATAEYELQVQNCTNFAVSAANTMGLNIPLSATIGNYGIGQGATPGKFGAYLKSMNLPTGATRNIGLSTSPSNKECQ